MSRERELLQRALEALSPKFDYALIDEIEAELAKPEPEPEPVGEVISTVVDGVPCQDLQFLVGAPEVEDGMLLYLAPPNYEAIKAERDALKEELKKSQYMVEANIKLAEIVSRRCDALKARIDGGVRVRASRAYGGFDVSVFSPHQTNATLIFDEGVEL